MVQLTFDISWPNIAHGHAHAHSKVNTYPWFELSLSSLNSYYWYRSFETSRFWKVDIPSFSEIRPCFYLELLSVALYLGGNGPLVGNLFKNWHIWQLIDWCRFGTRQCAYEHFMKECCTNVAVLWYLEIPICIPLIVKYNLTFVKRFHKPLKWEIPVRVLQNLFKRLHDSNIKVRQLMVRNWMLVKRLTCRGYQFQAYYIFKCRHNLVASCAHAVMRYI